MTDYVEQWPCAQCGQPITENRAHSCPKPPAPRPEPVAPLDVDEPPHWTRTWYRVARRDDRGQAVYVAIQATRVCKARLSCGGVCCLQPEHTVPHECGGCAPGEPDTCPA